MKKETLKMLFWLAAAVVLSAVTFGVSGMAESNAAVVMGVMIVGTVCAAAVQMDKLHNGN